MSVRLIAPTTKYYPSIELLHKAVNDLERVQQARGDIIVVWGARRNGPEEALNLAPRLSGLAQLQRFKDAGIGHPEFTVDITEAVDWHKRGMVTWGRECYHTMAKDIAPANSPDWWEKDFWVQVVSEPFEEWRIHVVKDKAIGRGLKIQTGPQRLAFGARSRRNGWTMRHDQDPPRGARAVAKRAVAACGYDFGAVDMICKDGGFVVLEVNRAPALSDYTAGVYSKAFWRLADGSWGRQGEGEETAQGGP